MSTNADLLLLYITNDVDALTMQKILLQIDKLTMASNSQCYRYYKIKKIKIK